MRISSNDAKHGCRLSHRIMPPAQRISVVEGESWIPCILEPKLIYLPPQFICQIAWYFLFKEKGKFFPDLTNDHFLSEHEIWLPLQSGLTLTGCIVNNSSFLSHSVWLCDLPQKWIPNTNHALENGDGSSLILDGRSIELGVSCSEFPINANLAGSKEFGEAFVLWNYT